MEGKGERRAERGWGQWEGNTGQGRSEHLSSISLAWQARKKTWRGRCPQLTASRASAQEARLPCPLMPSILPRFKRGNVLFLRHRPVETWQPLDGSDPIGILVTHGFLPRPLNCGCSHSKRLKATGSKRQKKSLFPALRCFHETAGLLAMAEGFRTF